MFLQPPVSEVLLSMLNSVLLLPICNPCPRRRNTAPPSLRVNLAFFGLLVADQQVSMLIVPMWHVLRNVNAAVLAKYTRRLVEDFVHFLQTAVRRLGEEEIHTRHDEGVDDREDNVRLVSDVREGRRGDHDHHEVEDPVGRGRNCVGRRADVERSNFSGVEPGHPEPTDGEEGVEYKEEDGLFHMSIRSTWEAGKDTYSCNTHLFALSTSGSGQHTHTQ